MSDERIPTNIFKCEFCGKIRKFGKWIHIEYEAEELKIAYETLLEDGKIIEIPMDCPDHRS